jgi:hypothetical protein
MSRLPILGKMCSSYQSELVLSAAKGILSKAAEGKNLWLTKAKALPLYYRPNSFRKWGG